MRYNPETIKSYYADPTPEETVVDQISSVEGVVLIDYPEFKNIRVNSWEVYGTWNGTPDGGYNNNSADAITENGNKLLFNPEADRIIDISFFNETDGLPATYDQFYQLTTEVVRTDGMGWIDYTDFDPTTGIITAPNHRIPNIDEWSIHYAAAGSVVISTDYIRYQYLDANRLQIRDGDNISNYPWFVTLMQNKGRLFSRRICRKNNHPVFVGLTGKTFRFEIKFQSINSVVYPQ